MKTHSYQLSFLFVFFLFASSGLIAQLNVGSTAAPDASAGLQVSTAGKGLLLPRVALTSTTTFGLTGSSNTAGMAVYNTSASTTTGAVNYPSYGAGPYSWDGNGWEWQGSIPTIIAASARQTVASSSATPPPATAIVFSTTPHIQTANIASVSSSAITINSAGAGTYKVDIDFYVTPVSSASTHAQTPTTVQGNYGLQVRGATSLDYQFNVAAGSGVTNSGGGGGNMPFHVTFITTYAANDQLTLALSNFKTGVFADMTFSAVTMQLLHK